MSIYYFYYIGYQHDGKIYPLGPYNSFGKLKPALWRSGSFTSNLKDDFYYIDKKSYSDELIKEFEYQTYEGDKEMPELKVLPLKELPSQDYIRTGYFLKKDVKQYEKTHCADELFYEFISPNLYASMLQDELIFRKQKVEKSAEEEENPTPYVASDYMFYSYPEYNSSAYESFVINTFADSLSEFEEKRIPKDSEIVVILHVS